MEDKKYNYTNLVAMVEHCICEGVWGDCENDLKELAKQSCNYCDLLDFIRLTIDKDNFSDLLVAYLGDL